MRRGVGEEEEGDLRSATVGGDEGRWRRRRRSCAHISLGRRLFSNPICLCEFLRGVVESYGISVDNEWALALPKICHISTPPLSTCVGNLQGVL
jgi:hypothetical protein